MNPLVIRLIILGLIGLQTACLRTRADLNQVERGAAVETQMQDLQRSKADLEARMLEYDSQFRILNGRIDSVQREVTLLSERKQETNKEEKHPTAEKFQLYEQALESLEKQVQLLSAQIATLKKNEGAASQSQDRGNYGQAEIDFKNKRWKSAIVGYQQYRDLNPNGRRYSDATYKIGVCFQELGMKSEAKTFYQEVIDKFPKSEEAKKARYRLKKL